MKMEEIVMVPSLKPGEMTLWKLYLALILATFLYFSLVNHQFVMCLSSFIFYSFHCFQPLTAWCFSWCVFPSCVLTASDVSSCILGHPPLFEPSCYSWLQSRFCLPYQFTDTSLFSNLCEVLSSLFFSTFHGSHNSFPNAKIEHRAKGVGYGTISANLDQWRRLENLPFSS